MGHCPRVVLVPTIQLQETIPDPSDERAVKPWAWDGPDLYWTTMEQIVLGDVRTTRFADCPLPALTGPLTNETLGA